MIGTPSPSRCLSQLWLVSIGYMIAFGSLFCKNYRIAKIFDVSERLKAVSITNWDLLKFVIAFVSYEIVFLIVWTFVDFPMVSLSQDSIEEDNLYYQCTFSLEVFPIISLFAKAAILLWGIYLSWKLRNVGKKFREGKFIALSIYNTFLCSIVGFPLIFFLSQFHTLVFVLKSFGTILIFIGVSAPVFLRIFYYLVQHFDKPPDSFEVNLKTLSREPSKSSIMSRRTSSIRKTSTSKVNENTIIEETPSE
eukprot:TRINITY_DN6887_c0_g2_i1.p1 TRINITY_DN6887_c0_g2~~TRINITY_DN6887_c0_g2_i1.p1  ORF type:complete len:250 (-),score=38.63 TRINITY_DN6887_c0_g2_i1:153-902(-)